MAKASKAATVESPAIIVFGTDDAGKPHASSFVQSEVDLARKAATLMGMRVLVVDTEADQSVAARVPKGRVFASGRAFTPFVKAPLFAELTALHGGLEPEPTASQPDAKPAAAKAKGTGPVPSNGVVIKQPKNWSDIRVGTIVLATAPPRHLEWFECVVVAVDADQVTLRFCDWPDEPNFDRLVGDVALMHPKREPAPPVEPEKPAEAA